ncbi:sporulation integral membrane protein YtvI [Paenibacillus protaetiae]|uniref:Sporulation integral membrane protein YtvI n=1 Tax=Paenibacillus protaetiae TaxID=2509456 RepID=A0A4P6EQ63_9BACL|nr:sporulation integral membrane protein YtvI [Paenibacillus protaetiae]QAY65090.1 sporulation integral membrane protein YtvI [Paenibacillus protaetiae]
MSLKTLVWIAVGLLLLYLMFTVGAPFLLALVVAIFLEPLTGLFIQRLKWNRLLASAVSSTLFVVMVMGLISLLGFKIVNELIGYSRKAPQYFQNASDLVKSLMDQAESMYRTLPPDTVAQLDNWLTSFTDWLTGLVHMLSNSLFTFASGIPSMFIFFVVFLVAVYMISFSLPALKSSILLLFDEKSRHQVEAVMVNLRRSIFGFIRSQLILSSLTYILSLLGLLLLDIRYAMAIALFIVVVDILPILGTGSVLVPWGVYLLITGDNTGVGLLVMFLVITVIRRIVEPKIVGDAVGIGALPALISLYAGLKLVGVIGVFLGPLVVIIYMAARKAGLFQFRFKL